MHLRGRGGLCHYRIHQSTMHWPAPEPRAALALGLRTGSRMSTGSIASPGPRPAPRKTTPRKPLDPLPRSRYSKWRALTLASVYVLMAVHVVHWRLAGKTLAPLELHEVMFTAELGIITAGFVLMALVAVGTLLFGRFFCSWACHMMALQEFASWILGKLHIRPRPLRSRFLLWVPPLVLVYMFGWPQISRMWEGRDFPALRTQTDLQGISSWVTTDFWRNLPDPWITALTFVVCGFLTVYFLGSRAFCTYGCPYGALFLTVDRLAPGRIRVNDNCVQCGTCTAVCTSGVRVHEEVARHGTIINPRCLKDLDCVSACPENALQYRWGAPSLTRLFPLRPVLIALAVVVAAVLVANLVPAARTWWSGRFDLLPFGLAVAFLGAVAYARTGMPEQRWHFSLGEETFMAVVFVLTLAIYRQLYDTIPFLLTIGLGGVAAFASVLLVRLVRWPDVRAFDRLLKGGGRLRPRGWAFTVLMLAFVALTVHSAFVQVHTRAGYTALAQARDPGADAGVAGAARTRALDHLEWSSRWGLFRSARLRESLAGLYLDRGDWARAESTLRGLLAGRPASATAHIQLGHSLREQGRLLEAEQEFEQALRVRTPSAGRAQGLAHLQAGASYELGALRLERGAVAEAEQALREAIRLEPDLAGAHYNLAIALFAQGRRDEAVAEADRAAALDPADAQTQALRARLAQP